MLRNKKVQQNLSALHALRDEAHHLLDERLKEWVATSVFKLFPNPYFVVVMNIQTSKFFMVSRTLLDAMEMTEDEICSKPYIDFVIKDHKEHTQEEEDYIIKNERELAHLMINTYTSKSGKPVHLEWSGKVSKINDHYLLTIGRILNPKP